MTLNLHSIVRTAITANFADETIMLVRSAGSINVKGRIQANYYPALTLKAQVQTLNGDDLQVIGETERTERDRKFYIMASPSMGAVPAGQVRVRVARTGDFIYRPAYSTFWKIYNVAEDFSPAGWVQVLASEQTEVPSDVLSAVTPDDGNGDTTPDDGDTTPDDGDTTPDDDVTTPDDDDTTPDDGDTTPEGD